MGIKKIHVLLFYLLIALGVNAQVDPENAIIHKIDGKKYYLHTVEQGNTLYSISKLYAIEIEEIKEANPGVENGITINQIIRIPAKKVDKKEFEENNVSIDGEFLVHEVQPKETLFSLGQQYKVKVQEIVAENPDIEKEGLKIGMRLKIPVVEEAEAAPIERKPASPDSLVTHVVKPKETLYSLAKQYDVSIDSVLKINEGLPNGLKVGQPVRIPRYTEAYKKQKVEQRLRNKLAQFQKQNEQPKDTVVFKDTFNFLLMLPFYLDMNDTIEAKKQEFDDEVIYSKARVALDIYKGVLFALDSLSGQKYHYKIDVFDTQNDSTMVKAFVGDSNFLKYDLVIGPLYKSNFEIANQVCKPNNIHQVSPVPLSNKILLGNPNVSKVIPSLPSHLKTITEYVLDTNDTAKVILINSWKLKDQSLFSYTKRLIKEWEIANYDSLLLDTIQTLKLQNVDTTLLNDLLEDSMHYKLIVPSSDQYFVTELLTRLEPYANNCLIEVFGLEPWMGYDNIDFEYFELLNVHVTSSEYINLSDEKMKVFYKGFRNRYTIDPSNFAHVGFRMMGLYFKAFDLYGKKFYNNYEALYQSYPQYQLKFSQTGLESGYENEFVNLLKYEGYQLIQKAP